MEGATVSAAHVWPEPGPEYRLRWSLPRLYETLDARRRERGITWNDADITGLATFPERYAPLAPLMIQALWAWHSFPNPSQFTLEQALVPVDGRGQTQRFRAAAS